MHILITGTSRGIGHSICELLLEKGHSVTGTSRSSNTPFPNNQHYTHLKCDLAIEEEVENLKGVFHGENIPEVLINNAGMFEEAQFDISDEDWLENWDKTLQVNLRSAALLSKWALNTWTKADIEGRLINISSRAGYRGDTGEYASYAASKGGMVAFTKSIARSFGKHGITAYTIAPGFVDTDMAQGSIEVYGSDYLTKDLALDSIAPPGQIAEITLLLAEGKLTHATGQTFHVNSGSYLI
ncbi:SDR family oxidoreductase [Gracilimonas mengyeensis]|uniref:NAD(P)-dependent dehydrogenase, short-chain alcohol dehydrogenase family n=1 Tax=Gracilimonas mengyeensis TaxID=1302730 RepID=A0A521ANX6_9BACT|nr:SDR family oxidoreductase [Gracilimonas mengyeensis]SMO36513.1 NAD(P)-dependent dehydrogenase, short-chain alcohol dehydrogenase family [Gracilimonas mengyeensis]